MYNSIHFRDYPMILAGILLFSLVFVLVNLCVDRLDAFLDPRLVPISSVAVVQHEAAP